MESFVAGIFSSKEGAFEGASAVADLATQGVCRVQSLGVYTRNTIGEFALEASEGTSNDLAFADSGAGQEALNELDERAPDGSHVLLVHLTENDPSRIDASLTACGATVVRRSAGNLESSGAARYSDE